MVLSRAVAIPRQYAFSGASVEVCEGPYGHAKFPEPPEEEEAFLCLLDCRIYVGSPGKIIDYHHSEELDTVHPFNLSPVDVDGCMFSFLSEVDDQFFSCANIERQIVFIVQEAKRQYRTKLEAQTYQTDSRCLWQGQNDITGYKMKQCKMAGDDTSLPDTLSAFYARFEQNTTSVTTAALTASDTPVPSVTASGVRSVFLRGNPRKARGPDDVPGRALRSCVDQLVE
eukprot:g46877.t1